MTDPTSPVADQSSRSWWRRLTVGEKTGVISLVVAVCSGVVVPLVVWQWPRRDPVVVTLPSTVPVPTPPAGSAPVDASPTSAGATPTVTPSPSDGRVWLDGLSPTVGLAYLSTKLPRTLEGRPELTHPLVVSCPSNSVGDKTRVVEYPLNRHYLDFSVSVRPYYPAEDQAEAVQVTVTTVTKRPDDTLDQQVRGQRTSTAAQPGGPVTVNVEDVDSLRLTVACNLRSGKVVLVDAGLTPR